VRARLARLIGGQENAMVDPTLVEVALARGGA
jgi:hypothetical protein